MNLKAMKCSGFEYFLVYIMICHVVIWVPDRASCGAG